MRLLFPSFEVQYAANCCAAAFHFLSKLAVRKLSSSILGADKTDVGPREFRSCTFFASGRAPFSNHIGGVLGSGAEPKVYGITANGIVATVADKKARWNWTIRKRICKNMSGPYMPIVRYLTIAFPTAPHTGQPRPATIWSSRFINSSPKPRKLVPAQAEIAAFIGTIVSRLADMAQKYFAAYRTSALRFRMSYTHYADSLLLRVSHAGGCFSSAPALLCLIIPYFMFMVGTSR